LETTFFRSTGNRFQTNSAGFRVIVPDMARIPASFLLVTCLLCMVAPIATAEEQPVAPENPPAVAPSPAAQEAPQESPSAPAVPSPDAPSPAPAPEQPQAVVASPEAVPDPSPAASVDPSPAPAPAASPEAVPAQPDADLLLSEEHAAGTGAGKPEGSEPYGAIDDDEFEHVNIAAFQPSHFLTFNLRPASEETFYVDVHKDVELGLPLQGNFFVTNGGDMKVNFEVRSGVAALLLCLLLSMLRFRLHCRSTRRTAR
jgi:hypothetical protein